MTISELIGQLKGYSAHEVNSRLGFGRTLVEWQSGYGVVSYGAKDEPWVRECIRNQEQHHKGRSNSGSVGVDYVARWLKQAE